MKSGEFDDDTLWLIVVGVLVVPILLGALPGLIPELEVWLLERQVLVVENVMWVPPGLSSGLDLPRVAILAAVVMFLVAGLGGLARTAIRSRAGR